MTVRHLHFKSLLWYITKVTAYWLMHEYPTGITSLNYIKPSNKQSMTSAKSPLRHTKKPFWCRTCSISAIKRGLDHGPFSIRKDCTDQRAPNLLNAASHLEVLPNGSNWT